MRNAMIGLVLALFVSAASGCSKKVLMPPRFDLHQYPRIGLVQFTSNSDGNLPAYTSQRFLQSIQSAQPGVRVLELGDAGDVLATIDHARFDHDAVRSLGERFDVDVVILGNLDVTDVRPSVDIGNALTSMSIRADVEATLTTRMLESASGATIWTRSARCKESVMSARIVSGGNARFDADNPDAAYGRLVDGLVNRSTTDFRPYWVRQ